MSQLPRTFFSNFTSLGRHWYRRMVPEHIERTKSSNFEFTVASYNVLADQLMEDNSYLYVTGRRKDPSAFDWNYRKHNLLKEIRHANADILCLQEVQEEHYYNWFSPRLQEHGYNGTFKKRSGDRPDGCATFFKRDKFSIEASYKIDYYRENIPLMDKNNVAILLFLGIQNNDTTKKSTLCVSNTHLLFNQRRGDIKLAQLAHLLADIEHHSRADKYDLNRLSIILCGDFNSRPFSPLYKLITTGELKYEGLSRVQVSGQLHDSLDNNKLGKTLFPSSIGLTNNCRWNDSEAEVPTSCREDGKRNKFMSTFNVETGMYEVLHRDETTRSTKSTDHDLLRAKFKKKDRQINDSGHSSNIDVREEPGYLRHGYSLSSCYSHSKEDGTPEVSTCHDRDASTVDYIFYSSVPRDLGKDQLYLNGVLGLYSAEELNEMSKLPNRFFSSDHLLMQAAFVLHQS